MDNRNNHSDDLKAIRKIMEESSRFLSLSGLSGVFIGIYAIAGSLLAWFFVIKPDLAGGIVFEPGQLSSGSAMALFIFAILILLAAITTAYIFARKRSTKNNIVFWSPVTRRLLSNLLIPLFSGAIFIVVLLVNKNPEYIVSSMLIFYGLGLINAAKFTFDEVQYLGVLELAIGIIAGFLPGYGLILWLIGFGVLHIFYGIILHRKYN